MATLLGHASHPSITYPDDHLVGVRVPVGGSNCAKCEYVSGQKCKNEHFIRWNKGDVIPAPVDRYCCDFFETGKAGSTASRAKKLMDDDDGDEPT